MAQDFIDALRDGREPPVTGEDGLAAVAMVEAGYRSSALGQAIDLTLTRSSRGARVIRRASWPRWSCRGPTTYRLDEALFRHEVATLLSAGYSHLYVFGTAGEGYAVDDAQFEQVARVFVDEMRAGGAEPMVGVISLSLETILERIAFARDNLGVRLFQISLPSWGALEDAEVRTFFDTVLGTYRGLSVPALQPAAHQAPGHRRRIRADRRGPSQPGGDQEQHRLDAAHSRA